MERTFKRFKDYVTEKDIRRVCIIFDTSLSCFLDYAKAHSKDSFEVNKLLSYDSSVLVDFIKNTLKG